MVTRARARTSTVFTDDLGCAVAHIGLGEVISRSCVFNIDVGVLIARTSTLMSGACVMKYRAVDIDIRCRREDHAASGVDILRLRIQCRRRCIDHAGVNIVFYRVSEVFFCQCDDCAGAD